MCGCSDAREDAAHGCTRVLKTRWTVSALKRVCVRARTHTHTRTHTMVSGHTVEAPTAVRHLPVLFRPFSQAHVCRSLARVLLACLRAVRACACGGASMPCAQNRVCIRVLRTGTRDRVRALIHAGTRAHADAACARALSAYAQTSARWQCRQRVETAARVPGALGHVLEPLAVRRRQRPSVYVRPTAKA